MRSEFNAAHGSFEEMPRLKVYTQGAASQAAPAIEPKSRLTRSRLAKPLLTSIATVTLLAASSFVVLATSSTGSLQPWDWTRVSLSGAASRYQACDQHTGGAGAIWCMLSSSFRPASAAGAPVNVHRSQPVFSVATIQDPASTSQAPAARPGSTVGMARSSAHGVSSGTQLVHLPRNATREGQQPAPGKDE